MARVGATLDETWLKDTLAAKHEADTLYALANPQYGLALSNHSGYAQAIAAVEATISAYRKAVGVANAVLHLPPGPQVEDAKTWVNNTYLPQFSERISQLESVRSTLQSLNSAGAGSAGARASAAPSPMLMMLAVAAAFAGGGALVGWVLLHSQKAALVGSAVGVATGVLTKTIKSPEAA